jgi:hypothetical protein
MTIGDPQCATSYDIAMPGCFYEGFAGGADYCEPACRTDWPWMCPAGFSCQPYDANYIYEYTVASGPCAAICLDTQQDGGYTPASGLTPALQSCYCPCVGSDATPCSGLGSGQAFCDSLTPDGGGTCAYGNFCRPGGISTCAGADAG